MKKTLFRLTLLTLALVLALSQAALAEPSDNLKAVFEAMTAEGSSFSRTKEMYATYYEGVSIDAALEDTGITVTVSSSNEYVQPGAWTFTEEGDYLTATMSSADFYGMSLAQVIMSAAASAQGVNTYVYNGYMTALTMSGKENRYLTFTQDEETGTTTFSINIAGPYELERLDEMLLTDDVIGQFGFEPLSEMSVSTVLNYGKISMLINGSTDSATYLVMEYGELDDAAYQAILSAVKYSKPQGWEAFTADYTALESKTGENYTAVIGADVDAVKEIIDEIPDGYSFAIFTIGKTAE